MAQEDNQEVQENAEEVDVEVSASSLTSAGSGNNNDDNSITKGKEDPSSDKEEDGKELDGDNDDFNQSKSSERDIPKMIGGDSASSVAASETPENSPSEKQRPVSDTKQPSPVASKPAAKYNQGGTKRKKKGSVCSDERSVIDVEEAWAKIMSVMAESKNMEAQHLKIEEEETRSNRDLQARQAALDLSLKIATTYRKMVGMGFENDIILSMHANWGRSGPNYF